MDIISLIIADHDEASDLIDQLDRIATDDARTSEAMRLVAQLAVCIKTHAKSEEKILYEAMRGASPELASLAREGPYDHQAIDMMVDKLVLHRPGAELSAILHVVRRLFTQHAREDEEADVLPALRASVPADELARLGHDFLLEKRRLRPIVERAVGAPARGTHDGRMRGLHVNLHTPGGRR